MAIAASAEPRKAASHGRMVKCRDLVAPGDDDRMGFLAPAEDR